MDVNEKIAAMTDLLNAAKRDLQLVDKYIDTLSKGRAGVALADDVSSDHRVAWLSAVDDIDAGDGIRFYQHANAAQAAGFVAPLRHTGTIRAFEDAAFVCTNILVAVAEMVSVTLVPANFQEFEELSQQFTPVLRLVDGSSGRQLINGMTQGPVDNDRGAVPFSYFSSIRQGLGATFKNSLFSEFTIPRGGTVRAEVYNLAIDTASLPLTDIRGYVTLLGYKVYGG